VPIPAGRIKGCVTPGLTVDAADLSARCDAIRTVVSESKCIDAASLAPKGKESQKQLRDTVRRINDAIFGDPKRLDRDLWLSRFSDLMLNGIQFPANSSIDLAAWRMAVREGKCAIHLRGSSWQLLLSVQAVESCICRTCGKAGIRTVPEGITNC